MSESKALVSNTWSALTTIDDFDIGVNKSNGNSIKTTKNISSAIVKSLFIESLIDQLCKLLEKDTHKQPKLYHRICSKLYELQLLENTYDMEELAPLRGYYQQALLDVMLSSDSRLCSPPLFNFGSSRYAVEYEEICFISSGGFGKVYKAKNRLDQVIYAVKKIPLRYQSLPTFERKLSEVKTLAKLNHPNIVQYKAAWLEPLFDIIPSLPASDFSDKSSDSDVVIFEHNNSNSEKENYQVHQESENNNSLVLCKFSEKVPIKKLKPQVSALLYVTMQLCDETLYEWLVHRNLNKSIDVSLAMYIMTEAAIGVKYIHSCNIVHHDIKPRNIFLSQDLKSIEVGDFGLSCCLQGHDSSVCPLEGGQCGTPLYAAPEQLKGFCDSKSDLFSLGLIFIELLTIFSTEMERVKVLNSARSGQLPSSVPLILIPLIQNLLSHQPDKRPTAEQLVRSLQEIKYFKSCITTLDKGTITETDFSAKEILKVKEAENIIKDKDKEIMELRQMLSQKEKEIVRLKQLVNKGFF